MNKYQEIYEAIEDSYSSEYERKEKAMSMIIEEAYCDVCQFEEDRFDAALDYLAADFGYNRPSIKNGGTRLSDNWFSNPDLLEFKRQTTHYLTLIKQGLDRNVLEMDHLKKLFELANVQEELVKQFMFMGA